MRFVLALLALVVALPALAQPINPPPPSGISARNKANIGAGYYTPKDGGAVGDARRAAEQIATHSGTTDLTLATTYEIFGATVSTNGTTTIGLTSPCGALYTFWQTDSIGQSSPGPYEILIPTHGSAGGTLNTKLLTVPTSTSITVSNAAGNTATDTQNVVIAPRGTNEVTSTSSAARGTYNAYACESVTVARGNATITVQSGTFNTSTDFTVFQRLSPYYTELLIRDKTGACPDFKSLILSVTATTATLQNAPTCAISGTAELWWGPWIPTSAAWAGGTSDAGKSIEVLNAASSNAHLLTTISSVADPAHLVLGTTTGATIVPGNTNFFNTELTWGTDDTTAFVRAATSAYNAGLRQLKFPAGTNVFAATFGNSSLNYTWALNWCGDGHIYFPRTLLIPRAVTPSCDNGVQPPQPSNTLNVAWTLRQAVSSGAQFKLDDWPGDSMLNSESNGAPGQHLQTQINDRFVRLFLGKPTAPALFNFAIGGTITADADPNGPNHGNGAGIPGGSTASLPVWYSNTSAQWYTYDQAKCPDVNVWRTGPNDSTNFIWGSAINVAALLQGSGHLSACGTSPDVLFVTDSYLGQGTPSNNGTSVFNKTDYVEGFFRSWALSCDYRLANGGCIGLIDLGAYRKASLYGWGDGMMPVSRANYIIPPSTNNAGTVGTLPASPYIWPVPVYGYAPVLSLTVASATTPAQFCSNWGGSISYQTGNASVATPTSATGNTTGLNLLPTGGVVTLSCSGSNTWQVYVSTFDTSTTATVTTTAGGSTVTCAAACTNMYYQNATIDVPGAGSAGGTYTGTVTAISADGKTITVSPTTATALTAQSKTVRFYHVQIPTTDTGRAVTCNPSGGNCNTVISFNMRDDGWTVILADPYNGGPMWNGYVARAGGGYFQPQITWTGTISSLKFQTDSGASTLLSNSGDYRPETGTIYSNPTNDDEVWGIYPDYSSNYWGGGNAHVGALGGMYTQQAVLNALHVSGPITTGNVSLTSGASLTAYCGQTILVNDTTAPTITLPAQCASAFPIVVRDIGGQAGSHTITVQVPAGTTLNGADNGTKTITAAYGALTITYSGKAALWN